MLVWPSYSHQAMARSLKYQGDWPTTPVPALAFDFWSLVDQSGGPDACWPWQGTRIRGGHGQVHVTGLVSMGAHRLALWLATGLVAHGRIGREAKVVRHLCHNPPCCNPAHLLLGSRSENRWDDHVRTLGVDLVRIRREVEAVLAQRVAA